MSYQFKYPLSKKSGFEQVIKAVRALNLKMVVEWNSVRLISTDEFNYSSVTLRMEDVVEYLNDKLEENELLKPREPEP